MNATEARQNLINLEIEERERSEKLDRDRKQLQQLLEDVDTEDRARVERRKSIREARLSLKREEALEEGRAHTVKISQGKEEYLSEFLAVAEDKAWYTGTGNDDAVLDHQWQGMMFGAVAERWILADGMGLGKTRTTIGWLDLVGARRAIVVCPTEICDSFEGEFMNIAPHRDVTNLYHLTPEKRHERLDKAVTKDGVIIVNYEMWRTDKKALAKLISWQADTVMVDEAHNIKSKGKAAYKNVEALVFADNMCPDCGFGISGLFDPEGLKMQPPRKNPMPCEVCGWKISRHKPKDYRDALLYWQRSKSVKNLVLITGTPILNDPADIFPLLHLCDPILFTTENAFRGAYCRKDHFADKWEFRPNAIENLKPLIEDRFLARTYEDAGVVIPKQHVHVVPVPLDKAKYPLQYRTIKQITKEAQIVLDSGEQMTIMHLVALITRKRQANVWPGGITAKDKEGNVVFDASEVNESAKIDALVDNLLTQHKKGARQVVFSQFTTALGELQARLDQNGIRAVRLDGSTKKSLRERIKTNFYRALGEEPEWDVVLANYKTGGVGLNLTGATATHILDEEWNPGKRNQAYGRTDRIGQTEETEVFVYRIPGSVDTWMANGIHRKELMIEGFNDTMDGTHEISTASFAKALVDGDIL